MLEDLLPAWATGPHAARNLLLVAVGYVALVVVSLAIVVGVVAALPVTYFQDDAGAPPPGSSRAAVVVRVVRNVLGLVVVAVGVVLSLPGVPGQGLLTILIGLMLMDFPGKRRLERGLAARPGVRDAMNSLRRRLGRPPLL